MESGMDFKPFWQLQPISNFAHSFHHFKWTITLRNQTPMSGLTYNLFPDLWGMFQQHIVTNIELNLATMLISMLLHVALSLVKDILCLR